MPQVFPNGFSTPMITLPILSNLGLINSTNYDGYVKDFPDLVKDSYIMAAEAAGKLKYTPQMKFRQWIDANKPMSAFKVTANVSGSAGATVTVTLTAASHEGTGNTLSPVAVGLLFENDADGKEYEVVAVNKNVAGAHTADLSPTSLSVSATIVATTAYFKWLGRPSVQEASFQQDGTYETWEPRERTLSIIRTNKKYSDLAKFEKLEYKGESYYGIDKTNLDKQHIQATEMQLMFGRKRDNMKAVGNANTEAEGMIPQILRWGTDLTGQTTLTDTFFEDLARSNDGDGFTDTYDILAETDFSIAWQNYLRNAGSNLTVNVDIDNGEIRGIFDFSDAVKMYGITYSVKKYAYFNSARTHGNTAGVGFWSGAAIFIPTGTFYHSEEGESMPFYRVRYMSDDEGGVINRFTTDGGLVGKNTTMNVELALTSYKGLEMYHLPSFKFAKIG